MSIERTTQLILALQAGSNTQQQLQDATGYTREGLGLVIRRLYAAGHIQPVGWGKKKAGAAPVLWGWKP